MSIDALITMLVDCFQEDTGKRATHVRYHPFMARYVNANSHSLTVNGSQVRVCGLLAVEDSALPAGQITVDDGRYPQPQCRPPLIEFMGKQST